jgi:hypothetical protein
MTLLDLLSPEAQAEVKAQKIKEISVTKAETVKWPEYHIHNEAGKPVPFHMGQTLTWDSKSRITGMFAGSQGGKTAFGPWWLNREVMDRDGGDFLAITATYDLFKLKMLPTMLFVFEDILKVGRYWVGDKVIEIKDPSTGEFLAKKSSDHMWARIVLRSADSLSGLESASAKGAWLDECGMDKFSLAAYKAIRRRLALYTGRMLFTTTLYNLGWLVSTVLDPIVADGFTKVFHVGEAQLDHTVSENKNATIIQFDSVINPQFPQEEFEEQKTLLSEEEFAMVYRGRKSTRKFLIYNAFDPQTMIQKPFAIPDEWKRYVGLDFGSTHMCAIFLAEDPADHRLYLYKEYLAGDKSIFQHSYDIREGEKRIDRACGGAQSEKQWRTEFSRSGIWVEEPPITDVDLGISRVYAQFRQANIIIFDTCYGILDEIGRYRRKRDGLGVVQDEIENKSDYHHLDALRYIISIIRPGVSIAAKVISLANVETIWDQMD